jgi:hypothetical protein
MNEPKVGFEVHGKFYPWVALDSWKTKESRVARHVAGCSLHKLLTGGSDNAAINMAFAAVAWWRGNPAADEDTVKGITDEWTAGDVKLVGFDALGQGTDAGPPDETPGSKPSASGANTSAETSETSTPKTSGSQPSEPTTESGPRPASES